MLVGHDEHMQVVALFDGGQLRALFVEQEGGHVHRQLHGDPLGVLLHGLFFQQAQDGQPHGLHAADDADAMAARADDLGGLLNGGTQPLAGHFQQAEAGDAADLYPGAVGLDRFAQGVFHLALVLVGVHVDEVDDDQPAQIAQAQLTGDFSGRFHVGVEGGLLNVAALGGAGGVDVDGGERLGHVDDDDTAGGQGDLPLEGGLDLGLDLEAGEQGNLVLIGFDAAHELGHHMLDELPRPVEGFHVINEHLADVLPQVVADGAGDDVGFLIDEKGRRLAVSRLFDGIPQLHQIVHVPLQFLGALADAGGAHDQPHAFRHVHAGQGFAQFGPVLTLDAAGDAAGAGVVGHHDHIGAGEGDLGGQRSTLVAALLLLHLDDELLTLLEHVADGEAMLAPAVGEELLGHFLEGQKAVALGTVIDEGGFQTGFDAGDLALVDVGLLLLVTGRFDIQIVELLAIDQRNPDLFRLRGVDEHSFHDCVVLATGCWNAANRADMHAGRGTSGHRSATGDQQCRHGRTPRQRDAAGPGGARDVVVSGWPVNKTVSC